MARSDPPIGAVVGLITDDAGLAASLLTRYPPICALKSMRLQTLHLVLC